MTLLEVSNLTLINSYNSQTILKDITFSLKKGEILGVLGESGSGKSLTALSILNLLPSSLKIVSGQIRFAQQDLLKLKPRDWSRIRGKEISIIFQDPLSTLNPVLNIGEQLREIAYYHLGLKGLQAKELIIKTLKEVGISDPELRLRSYPHELSGGLRQRVMIAMSILCSPRLLIADEPTTALDLTIQMQIIELLKTLNKERELSILFITHDLGVLRWFAHRILVYYQGQILESALTERLFARPLHPYTQVLFASYPGREKPLQKEKPVKKRYMPAYCGFADRCPYSCKEVSIREPLLIEVEPDHYVRCHLYAQ